MLYLDFLIQNLYNLIFKNAYAQIGAILLIVFIVSLIMRFLKQPLIIGYIISGIISGPIFLNLLGNDGGVVKIFSQLGISFLLFIVGLKLSPKVIKEVGKAALVTGLGQIIFTSIIGYFICIALGFDNMTSLYLSIALTFSSTIIMMKLLSDKDDLDKLYGKISRGFLLVQDFVAIFILIAVSSIAGSGGKVQDFFYVIFGGTALVLFLVPISIYGLPRLSSFFAKSQEFLFLFAIFWAIGIDLLFNGIGYSIGVGALIAGICLSFSDYSVEISSRMKPLRDFFLISFFIVLGSQMVFGNISNMIYPAIILSLFILIGNPLIVVALMGIMGYSKKTGFMAGLTVAQISEFSFILISLGISVGHLKPEILPFITIIGLTTIAGSTYMVMGSDKIYPFFEKPLRFFERKKIIEKEERKNLSFDYVLLGYNRIGFSIVKSLLKSRKKFIVIDYNPEVVKLLKRKGISAFYGDVDDIETLEEFEINKAKVIVSTIPERDTNLLILEFLRAKKSNAVAILTGRQIEDALDLYGKKADYVIMPHFLGGEYASRIIEQNGFSKEKYEKERKKEINQLHERLKEGQKHPRIEKER